MQESGHSDHATAVTTCTYKLASNSEYYNAALSQGNDMLDNTPLQWFVDNGVNVINMSFGYAHRFSSAQYSEISRFFDKFVTDNI